MRRMKKVVQADAKRVCWNDHILSRIHVDMDADAGIDMIKMWIQFDVEKLKAVSDIKRDILF